jgi:hypothetical protein
MENPTSFDLNETLRRWRADLRQSPQLRQENLAELEAHLRDGIAAWQARGLTQEEAFLLAARRLGCPAALEPEFAKVNRHQVWLDRLLWMLVGIQLIGIVSTVSRPVADAAVIGGLAGAGYNFQAGVLLAAALLVGGYLIAMAGAIAAVSWWIRRMGDRTRQIASWLLRWPIVAGLLIVILMFAARMCSSMEWALLSHSYQAPTLGSIATTQSLSGGVFALLETVVLAAVTVILLRRRWTRAGVILALPRQEIPK